MKSKLIQAGVLIFVCGLAHGRAVADYVLNFDDLPAAGVANGLSGSVVTDYFAQAGITLTNNSPDTRIVVLDVRDVFSGEKLVAPSPFNVIGQSDSLDPVSYTLNFAVSQDYFSMTRVGIIAGSTGTALPYWRARAFDALGHELGSVGEDAFSISDDIPSQTFRLDGPGIRSVRIESDNGHFAALGSVVLDDFTYSTAVPEPSSLVLAGVACIAILGCHAMRRAPATCLERGAGLE